MKRLTLAVLALATAAAAFADDLPQAPIFAPGAEKLIRESLPVCSAEAKVKAAALQHKLPPNMTGKLVQIESERQTCQGQWLAITSTEGGFYLGIPWFLDEQKDLPTLEEKVQQFAWKNLQQNVTVSIDRSAKTRDGLYKLVMKQVTERGFLPFEGEIDPAGTVVLLGHMLPLSSNPRSEHLKQLQQFIADSPATGAAKPEVTVIEFSDFECPSCQRSSGYMKPIVDKYGDKVRYIRYDLPLVSMHPWALSAAVAGRAVYRQKPAVFWDFKKAVYENQDKLNTFTIDDFTRGFAQDHELDMKRYDADVASKELRDELMTGAGLALSNDVRATPTYMVNGVSVDPGDRGEALLKYIETLLKK